MQKCALKLSFEEKLVSKTYFDVPQDQVYGLESMSIRNLLIECVKRQKPEGKEFSLVLSTFVQDLGPKEVTIGSCFFTTPKLKEFTSDHKFYVKHVKFNGMFTGKGATVQRVFLRNSSERRVYIRSIYV